MKKIRTFKPVPAAKDEMNKLATRIQKTKSGLFPFLNRNKLYFVLDIGSHSLKVVSYTKEFGRLKFRETREISYAGEFDFNDPSEKRIFFLKTALGEAIPPSTSQSSQGISIILPSSAVFIQPTTLPPVRGRIVRQTVEFEVKEKIPCSLADLVWDYIDLSPKTKGARNVILAAARREIVEDCFSVSKGFGRVERISAGPVLIYEALRKSLAPSECLLVLDIGAKTLDVIVVLKNDFWSRSITYGASKFIHSTAEAAGMSEEELQTKLRKEGIHAAGLAEIIQTTLSELLAEIERTIAICRQEIRDVSFSGLLILGGLTQLKGIDACFSEAFDIPLVDLSSLTAGNLSGRSDASVFFKAVSFAEISKVSLNLIPREERESRRASKAKGLFTFLSLTIAIILAFPLTLVFLETQKIKHESFAVDENVKTLNSYKQQIEAVRKNMEPWQKLMEDAQKSLDEKDLTLRIFKELETILQQSFWLDEIQYEAASHKLVLDGNMRERLSDISRLEEGFKRSDLFGKVEVKQGYVQPDGTRRFSCVVEVKP